MDSIFKVLIALLCGIYLLFTCVSSTLGFSSSVAAENYFQDVTQVIEESNYSASVINDCIEEAAGNGYTLTVAVGGTQTPGSARYAKVELKYKFSLKLFNLSWDKKISKII